jgi:Ca-activated chloride channel homolog
MKFAEPQLFVLLFLPLIIFFAYLFYIRKRKQIKSKLGDIKLVEKMCLSVNYKIQSLKIFFMILSCILLVFAVCRPQWGTKLQEIKRKGLDIMFILDLSKSMLAQDIPPSRLEYAKLEISNFIDKLKGDRVGICGFAGQAFVYCPLTLDYSVVKLFLDMLNPDAIPTPGTKIGDAVIKVKESFTNDNTSNSKYKIAILITDGEDIDSDWHFAVQEAVKSGFRIYTVGIGTPEGEPIPIKDENGDISGYKKDPEGKVVMSKLNEPILENIAILTGAGYSRGGLDKVYQALSHLERRELTDKFETQYQDKFQWFLLPAIVLLIAGFMIPERKKNA